MYRYAGRCWITLIILSLATIPDQAALAAPPPPGISRPAPPPPPPGPQNQDRARQALWHTYDLLEEVPAYAHINRDASVLVAMAARYYVQATRAYQAGRFYEAAETSVAAGRPRGRRPAYLLGRCQAWDPAPRFASIAAVA